jgi:hypothetical protein
MHCANRRAIAVICVLQENTGYPLRMNLPLPLHPARELAPHYYRDNFLRLCDTVEAQYGDLLMPAEQALLRDFRGLPFGAQCLYVRLVSRVGPWFRESRLCYPELGEVGPLLDTLMDSGMAVVAEALTLEQLGRLYTRAELERALGARLPGGGAPRKGALLQAIGELGLEPRDLLRAVVAVDSARVVAPGGVEWVQLLQLLFFGNRHQNLVEFVLSDLGVARYYPYSLDRAHRLFASRAALDEYLACVRLSDGWHALREGGDAQGMADLAREIAPLQVAHPSSERRWYRLRNGLARELERFGEELLAQQLYQGSGLHPARERRARILERRGEWRGAAGLCREILAAPWCEAEREAAQRILARTRRRLHGTPVTRRRDDFAAISLQLPPGDAPVEQRVAEHLAGEWCAVHYVENQLMCALFGLAFWEEIFAPLPGAFNNPFQGAPTDMYEQGFSARRRERLAARLAQLRSADLRCELPGAYRRYAGYQCRWVNWRRIDGALLEAAAAVIPADHLLAVWERILFDPGENRRGFPDLIALGGEPGEYCLIEVKAPGDALQENQKRWLRFFAGHGIPARVAWVAWCDG